MKPDLDLLYPLTEFYEQSGAPLPAASRIDGASIPSPYRELLVHDRDMTPTMEAACGRKVRLRVLQFSVRDDVLSREIVLVPEGMSKPLVFGAIRIYLRYFPDEARRLVLELVQPLGAILYTRNIPHTSRPDAYFQVRADSVINAALGLQGSPILYGRRNVLRDGAGNTLARVLEILPPDQPA
jgi:chorismate-pyruvate lyase